MKFKFEVTKQNIRFLRFKRFYFIKSCKGQRCLGCELNDQNDCFALSEQSEKIFFLFGKGRF